MFLHISAYSIRCLLSPFSAISRRFVIRARVGGDIIDCCGLLIVLATLDALCWIMSGCAHGVDVVYFLQCLEWVSQFELEFNLL